MAAKELIDREFIAAHPNLKEPHEQAADQAADPKPFKGIIDPTLVIFEKHRCYVMASSFKGKRGTVESYSATQAVLRLDTGQKVTVDRHCVLV